MREKAAAYAAERNLVLLSCLGWGNHGSVWLVAGNGEFGPRVVKFHRQRAPYVGERDCYERLRELGITEVRGVQRSCIYRMR